MSDTDEPIDPRSATMDATAFECPYCGAMAQQRWFGMNASAMDDGVFPSMPDSKRVAALRRDHKDDANVIAFLDARTRSKPTLLSDSSTGRRLSVANMFLSRCMVCTEKAVWLRDRVIWPVRDLVVQPNPDLPEDVRQDFEEAAAVVQASPRSAAALLRLAIEKICKHLNKRGSIDTMIAALVKDGLSTKIQRALDVVRVVGNESVHPGEMNINDDAETARALFELVNIIAETMISEPKRIDQLFHSLPASKLEGIRARDAQKT